MARPPIVTKLIGRTVRINDDTGGSLERYRNMTGEIVHAFTDRGDGQSYAVYGILFQPSGEVVDMVPRVFSVMELEPVYELVDAKTGEPVEGQMQWYDAAELCRHCEALNTSAGAAIYDVRQRPAREEEPWDVFCDEGGSLGVVYATSEAEAKSRGRQRWPRHLGQTVRKV